MKYLIALSFLFIGISAWAVEYQGTDGGKVRLSIATVGGKHVYTVAERNAEVAATGGVRVDLAPTFYEFALSTTIVRFGSDEISPVDDYRNLLTSKAYIADRVVELEKDVLAFERIQADFPSINVTPKLNKLKAQINLLGSIWGSL